MKKPVAAFGLAVLLVLLATLGRLALAGVLHDQAPLLLFIPAIIAAALFDGLGPGLLATLLSLLLGDYFFLAPAHSLLVDPQQRPSMVFLGCLGLALVAGSVALPTHYRRNLRSTREQATLAAAAETDDQRFLTLARATNDIIWDWDLRTDAVWWNEGLYRLFGYAPATVELTASWWYTTIHPQDRERVVTGIHQAIDAADTSWQDEYRFQRADGSFAVILDRGTIIRDAAGAPLHMLGAMLDVTERRQTTERLELSAEIGAIMAQSLPLDTALERCCAAVVDHLDAALARIWLLESGGDVLALAASTGTVDAENPTHLRVPIGQFKVGHVASARQAHLTNDVQHDPWLSDAEWAVSEGLVAFAGYPLVVADQLLGVIALFSRQTLAQPMLQALSLVADGVAVGIERQRSLQALRTSEERYRALTEVSPQVVWMASAAGAVTYCNQHWYDYTGLDQAATLGQGWRTAIEPDHLPMLLAEQRQAVINPSDRSVETLIRRADGTYRWHLIVSRPVLLSPTQVAYWIGVALDVDGLKRTETTLLRTQEHLQLAVDATGIGTWDFYPRTRILKWDPQCKALFGVPADAFVDYAVFLSRIHPDDRAATDAVAQAALDPAGAGSYAIEYRTLSPADGRERWLDARGQALFNSERTEALRFIGSVMDITARKQADLEREQLLERAQQAQAAAEHASRLKDEFLATVSHELRTPLTAILGWTQMMRRRQRDPEWQARALATIEQNAQLQMKLIEDILDVSRIITGKLHLDVTQLDLVDVIDAAIMSIRPAAQSKDIRLQTVLDSRTGPVLGDFGRLQQVVWNLLSNAIKFTPRGGRVQISLQRVNSHIEIHVADSGPGIAPEFLPYAFDRFRQAESTASRSFGGLGLGLAIVRHLIELHGGTVAATSPGPNQGALFVVTLPGLAALAPESAPDRPRTHPTLNLLDELDCPPELSGLRVLIVEDEPDSRNLLVEILRDCAADVQACPSAAEGLATLRSWRPDVLISDIGLPGQDGYGLIRAIRALPAAEGGATPAMALTAFARVEDRIRALSAGYQIHAPKPIDPAELIVAVASLARRPS